jgi:cell division protein FtsI (penicillin-binding protein 3)
MWRDQFLKDSTKIFTDVPSTNEIKNLNKKKIPETDNFNDYFTRLQNARNLSQMLKECGMDAIALLENLGIEVKAVGLGKVKTQSLQAGQDIMKNQLRIIVIILKDILYKVVIRSVNGSTNVAIGK